MGKNIAIQVENLSKAYQLGQIGTGTISRDLERFWTTKIRGKEDPFLKIGQTNDRTTKGESDIVWSLRDLNFEIEQGAAVGIIGRNGAGKSTLLKLLSRVTSPTSGNIKVRGRIASLLEVGTGFHPELSGRENIFLNGAILGMRRSEIQKKFDEIVDFAGVERYVDTPVKRYSSGMYVRLAFAVAAHLESEILIVDEVLAVGDAEFQRKCLGKMGDISKGQGRTVLFVSHNMASIQALCGKCILLENGIVVESGVVENVITKYFSKAMNKLQWNGYVEYLGLKILKTSIYNEDKSRVLFTDAPNFIKIDIEVSEKLNEIGIGLVIKSRYEEPLVRCFYNDYNDLNSLAIGKHEIIFKVPSFTFASGSYFIDFDISLPNIKKISNEECSLNFDLVNRNKLGNRYDSSSAKSFGSILRPDWLESITSE
jgi:lipopolysaccharide transport system ATP-binding protein